MNKGDRMSKEKRNIATKLETESKYLTNILDKDDVKNFKKLIPELQDTWMKKQMFRTETEMRFSVLSDNKYPTKAAKYWQSVREQNTHFENLVHLSFDARKNEVEIKKLQRDIKKEKDPLEKELKQVELEEKLYGKAQMELVAKHRMREVATWSKLKKEFDDGNFDKNDVNTHQAKSYLLRLQRQKETITPGTSQPEVFNVLGQLEALEKGLRENTLSLDAKKTKKIKMKFDFVYLGQTVLKYQVPLEIFVGLNEIYERQKKQLPKANKQLVGKIQDEVSLFYSGPNNDKMHQHCFLPDDILNGFIVSLITTQIGTR